MKTHRLGLVLGAENDWPRAFEALTSRLGEFEWRGERHVLDVNRVTYEPFDLRYKPRYALVLDRVGWWYLLPREWLKKVALMDDVYLLNNPFTFQAMEKHSAYCAMMRLGLADPSQDRADEAVDPPEAAEPRLLRVAAPAEITARLEEEPAECSRRRPVRVQEGERAEARAEAHRPARQPRDRVGERAGEARRGGIRLHPVLGHEKRHAVRAKLPALDEPAKQPRQPHLPLIFGPVEHDEESGARAAADLVQPVFHRTGTFPQTCRANRRLRQTGQSADIRLTGASTRRLTV